MKLLTRLRDAYERFQARSDLGMQGAAMRCALQEVGWLGSSGGTAADDIRHLAQAWANSEIRTERLQRQARNQENKP